ncbi:uncharacterized protein LOC128081791 isoform X1 [Tympanuchus pallidicinctus]|uniref:uncharacterized protein LOC128081791 isoform X1 n=2 Tax=Tympanuchus pallidicinctus TaxID=109042 RepID=UPI0022873602|nr:uncharacterized protein LOC128081791 isoform X1 [Tympanuchus pallidicinctus]
MAAVCSAGGAGAAERAAEGGLLYGNRNLSAPGLYVLQPWIVGLLLNHEQPDGKKWLTGQVLRVLSGSSAPGQGEVQQDAVLQVSDGSHYIRVIITAEALQAEENAHMQFMLSSLICRLITLQKYTLCFREEAKLEDCEFYLTAQRFVVLPMERQRMDSSNVNQEPSVLQKIKELWMRNLSMGTTPSSEPSLSQLLEVIAQDQLEVLKENAEECLDLQVPKETSSAEADKLPVTRWEAELQKEPHEDVFIVPANILVIPAEEAEVDRAASQAATCGASPEKSGYEMTVPGDQSIIAQARSAESTVLSEDSEASLDNPWNRLPPVSLTLSSSEEKSHLCSSPRAQEAQQEVAADSNTPDLLEPCSHDSPQALVQDDSVQTSSPSLLTSYCSISPVKADMTQATSTAEAACSAPCAARVPLRPEDSQANVSSVSPVLPVLPSSHLASRAERAPHQEQADSSGTAFPLYTQKHHLGDARAKGGESPRKTRGAAGAKRKLLVGDGKALPHPCRSLGGLQRRKPPQNPSKGTGGEVGRKLEFTSPQRAKKSRREIGPQCEEESLEEELDEEEELELDEEELELDEELDEEEEEEEEEEEQASSVKSPNYHLEQHRDLQPYVNENPPRYKYEPPGPELCKQIQSIRLSKAMMMWASWIVTERDVDF